MLFGRRSTPQSFTALILLVVLAATAHGLDLYPLFGDINADGLSFGTTDAFADSPPYFLDDAAVNNGNNIAVYTMNGPSGNNGAGFSVAVSNGENGIDATDCDILGNCNNPDIPNTEPVNPAILSVNGGNKLQNGNAIRLSVWLRQDPTDPVTVVPQIEPVLKIELWKEALSTFADFSPNAFPGYGDRVWDTDQNAGNSAYIGFNQSQASWVDMNNSGTTSFGKPVAQSLVTEEWRLVETTLVVDDDPFDDGFGWQIGIEQFDVTSIEEIRGVMYFGDFAGTNLTDAGSIWADNILIEIFATEADLNNTPNSNPMPTAGLVGDFDGNGLYECADVDALVAEIVAGNNVTGFDITGDNLVNGADLTEWRTVAGAVLTTSGGAIPEGDADLSGSVDGSDFGVWNANKFMNVAAWCSGDFNASGSVDGSDFGIWNTNKFTSADSVSSVPEPATIASLALGGLALLFRSRRIQR